MRLRSGAGSAQPIGSALLASSAHAAPSFRGLGDLPGGVYESSATAISADGSTVVGQGNSASGYEAFVWRNGIMLGLGDLPGSTFTSTPYNLSADGNTIVGYGFSAANGLEAWRWTPWTGMVGLGDLPGGSFISYAYGVSADGSIVVGTGHDGDTKAFRWTQATGIVPLGDIAGGIERSGAAEVSADGSVVVGQGNGALGIEAFRWDPGDGDARPRRPSGRGLWRHRHRGFRGRPGDRGQRRLSRWHRGIPLERRPPEWWDSATCRAHHSLAWPTT